ncbi:hypothetical protein M9H77_31970 [Catharanthus roseus]|uniref:Uncharacterized protein n=1 Tax=Catharanthus roseus TaxID=4058 RepID=A0ACC0A3Y7_CATRO|nr:hypothetical protein M9H77_31970 [Catharanthus roseus]
MAQNWPTTDVVHQAEYVVNLFTKERRILLEILQSVIGKTEKFVKKGDEDLEDVLRTSLKAKISYLQDAKVPIKRLIWLWVAEGFDQLHKEDNDNLEKPAEAYLNHLIARSLVTLSKRSSLGTVKASCIHALFHDFACRKAKEDFF